jgi:hypothetical protein
MNPYLEQDDAWQDFHDRFVPALGDALGPQVSPHFIVKVEAHLYLHEMPADQRVRVGYADVGVSRRVDHGAAAVSSSVILQAPARIVIPSVEIEKQAFLEIRDQKNRDLVAVIELLSPSNKKAGSDREQYLAKRGNLLRSKAHFIEIDLLRGWERMPCEKAPECDYCVLVSRAEERPHAGFWPIRLRERLPVIPVPLREPLCEARLNLQEILHSVYDRAYYKDYIYADTPHPSLSPEDSAWAAAILAEKKEN